MLVIKIEELEFRKLDLHGLKILVEWAKNEGCEAGNFVRTMKDGKTTFLLNNLLLGEVKIPQSLINTALEKEGQINK